MVAWPRQLGTRLGRRHRSPDAALAQVPGLLFSSLRARFLSCREGRVRPLLLGSLVPGCLRGCESTCALLPSVLSLPAQSVQTNFVLAAAEYLIGLSAPESCFLLLVALAPAGTVLAGSFLLLGEFFLLAIELVKLLCLSNGGDLGGSRLCGIIVKPLLNVCRQLGKIKLWKYPP